MHRWRTFVRFLMLAPAAILVVFGCGEDAGTAPSTSSPSLANLAVGDAGGCVQTRSDERVFCWSSEPVTVPSGNVPTKVAVEIVEARGARKLVVGPDRACAIEAGGDISCWTIPADDETYTMLATPTLSGVTDLALGLAHSCVVANGAAYCFGENSASQLGDGSTRDSAEPVAATGLNTVKRIYASGYTSCSITANGAVYCWGDTYSFTGTDEALPAQVPNIIEARDLALSSEVACAALESGAPICWGRSSALQELCYRNGQACNRSVGRDMTLCEGPSDCPGNDSSSWDRFSVVLPENSKTAFRVELSARKLGILVGKSETGAFNDFYFPWSSLYRCYDDPIHQAYDVAIGGSVSCVLGFTVEGLDQENIELKESLTCPGMGFSQDGNTTYLCDSATIEIPGLE